VPTAGKRQHQGDVEFRLSHAGVTCTVKDHRWTGRNLATNTEFNEVVCEGGAGYMLATALPGSTAPIRAVSCHDSAMQNLPCKLSDNVVLVTLRTFKDTLAQHQIACDAGDKDIRVFGQENIKKQYVVQFRCAQNGTSLVAFIPLQGATAPSKQSIVRRPRNAGSNATDTGSILVAKLRPTSEARFITAKRALRPHRRSIATFSAGFRTTFKSDKYVSLNARPACPQNTEIGPVVLAYRQAGLPGGRRWN
jgi:hypothetical protein